MENTQIRWATATATVMFLLAVGTYMFLRDASTLPWFVLTLAAYYGTLLWRIPDGRTFSGARKTLLFTSLVFGGILMWLGLDPARRPLWFYGFAVVALTNIAAHWRQIAGLPDGLPGPRR